MAAGPLSGAEIKSVLGPVETPSPLGAPLAAGGGAGGISYFQAPLPDGSVFKGSTLRDGVAEPAAIAQAIKAAGRAQTIWPRSKTGHNQPGIALLVDPALEPMIQRLGARGAEEFLDRLFESAPFAHGDALTALSASEEPVTVALLDRSENLLESHAGHRLIGVNRALFEKVGDPALRRALLTAGLSHELRHLAEPPRSEADRSADDARLFIHLTEAPWKKPAGWLAGALSQAIAPDSLFQSLTQDILDRMDVRDAEGGRLRSEHMITSGHDSRERMEKAKDAFAGLASAAPTERLDHFWDAVWKISAGLAGRPQAAEFHLHVLPALVETLAGDAWELAVQFAMSADAASDLPEDTVRHALPTVIRTLAGDSTGLFRALKLLEGAASFSPSERQGGPGFGLYGRVQGALASDPSRLDSVLYIAELFGRNGIDPMLPQHFLTEVSPDWSIPQTWRHFPKVAFDNSGRAVGFEVQDAAQARELAAFAKWVGEVTDVRFAFPPLRATAEGLAALEAELAALDVPADFAGEGLEQRFVLNPDHRPAEDVLAELKAPRPAAARPAPRDAAPSWANVVDAERRDAVLILDQAVDYLRRDHLSEQQKIHRYQEYSEPTPLVLAELFPEHAAIFQAQAETELRALGAGGNFDWKAWKSSMRKLGDSLLASGDRAKARSIYAEAFTLQNGLDIALSLARAGEHDEALRCMDAVAGLIASGLPFGVHVHELGRGLRRLREPVDAALDKTAAEGFRIAPEYRRRLDRIARKLVNHELVELDRNLERSVLDWTAPRVALAGPQDGLLRFIERIRLDPRRDKTFDFPDHSQDGMPAAKPHSGWLQELWNALSLAIDGVQGAPAWATGIVERLWDSPVKAALFDKLAEKTAPGEGREALIARGRAAAERYETGSPIRELEREGAVLPGRERFVWEMDIFTEQRDGRGHKLTSEDNRVAYLNELCRRLAAGDRSRLAAGRALARALGVELLRPGAEIDGLFLLRFGAVRAFIDAALAAGELDAAARAALPLQGGLRLEGLRLLDDARRLESAGREEGLKALSLKGDGRLLVKMGSEIGLLVQAKLARARLAAGDEGAARFLASDLARSYRDHPSHEDEDRVLAAAKLLAESPELAPAGAELLSAAIAEGRGRSNDEYDTAFHHAAVLAETALDMPSAAPRGELFNAALDGLIERFRSPNGGRQDSLGFERRFERLLDLLERVVREPGLASGRARLLAELRASLEAHRFDPDAEMFTADSPPTGWAHHMVRLAKIAAAGALGSLNEARRAELERLAPGDAAHRQALSRLFAASR